MSLASALAAIWPISRLVSSRKRLGIIPGDSNTQLGSCNFMAANSTTGFGGSGGIWKTGAFSESAKRLRTTVLPSMQTRLCIAKDSGLTHKYPVLRTLTRGHRRMLLQAHQ